MLILIGMGKLPTKSMYLSRLILGYSTASPGGPMQHGHIPSNQPSSSHQVAMQQETIQTHHGNVNHGKEHVMIQRTISADDNVMQNVGGGLSDNNGPTDSDTKDSDVYDSKPQRSCKGKRYKEIFGDSGQKSQKRDKKVMGGCGQI